MISFFIFLLITSSLTITIGETFNKTEEYGVDVSFPMHYINLSTNYPWLPHNLDPNNNPTPAEYKGMSIQPLGDRSKFYADFMNGCREHYGNKGHMCDSVERDRTEMTLKQPQSMVNYTDVGFKKIRAPAEVYRLVKEFWEKNKGNGKKEKWFSGNTYTNHWDSPTYMVSVEDTSLRGGGSRLKQKIWDAAKSTLTEWTGEELTQCSLYGIRVYYEGAVLAPHVDRLPLVSSAIINVDQDLDEPWPIEVIGRDGKAHNITMEPGDMVLYESHSIIHGRPFSLKGRFYANIFIHFEPIGHSLRHHNYDNKLKDVDASYEKASRNKIGGHEGDHHGLPVYLMENTPWEKKYKQQHPGKWKPTESSDVSFTTGSTDAHTAAAHGNVEKLKTIARDDPDQIHAKDINGWKPLHEGARGGHIEVVKLLVGYGSDINEPARNGATPLHFAEQRHGKNHPIIKMMKSLGAVSMGPDL